jgi:uncharacterized membrane protein
MLAQRIARHWYQSLHPARRLLPAASLAQIETEIQNAERTHAGEIRVAVETALSFGLLWHNVTPRARALHVFSSLRIWDTKHNNGVLIYVLLADRAIEIVADRGIAAHIPPAEWQALCDEVSERFRRGDLTAGCCVAVQSVGRRLARFFPGSGDNGNELPNQPVLL